MTTPLKSPLGKRGDDLSFSSGFIRAEAPDDSEASANIHWNLPILDLALGPTTGRNACRYNSGTTLPEMSNSNGDDHSLTVATPIRAGLQSPDRKGGCLYNVGLPRHSSIRFRTNLLRVVGVPALLLAILGIYRTFWDENLVYLGHTAFDSIEELKQTRRQMIFPERFKGHQDVFSINRMRDNAYFFINGFISIPLNSPSEKLVGAFASLFAPRTDRALVLGVGSGATAGTVAMLFDRTDGVEINPVVLENLNRMADHNFNLESRPQARLILDDALHFIKVSREQYSLILSTVTTPLYFSSSKLYTRDFFEMVRRRLKPDGIYVTWFDTRVGDRGADIILKTLSQSFQECWIGCIRSGYFLLICSQQKIAVQQPRLIAGNPVLSHYFDHNGLRPDWLPYGLLTTRAYDLIKNPALPINTLDYPALEFEIARLGRQDMEGFLARLQEKMSVPDVGKALEPVMGFQPLDLALHVNELLGDSEISDQWKRLVSVQASDFDQQYHRARLQYAASYANSANTANAHYTYGSRLLEQGTYSVALKEFRRAVEINPKRNNAYFNIGACYEQLGEFELALKNYARELKVDPEDLDVMTRMGRVYYKARRYREALACLNTARPGSEQGMNHFYRGLALEALGFRSEAETSLQRALMLVPNSEEAFTALARVIGAEP